MCVTILVFLCYNFLIIYAFIQHTVIAGDTTNINTLGAQVNQTSNIANLMELTDLWKETEIEQKTTVNKIITESDKFHEKKSRQ